MSVRTKQAVRQRNAEHDPYEHAYEDWSVADATSSRPSKGKGKGSRSKKSKARKRQKSPLWAKLMVTFGALLMVAAGAAIVGAKSVFSELESKIQTVSIDEDAAKPNDPAGGKPLSGAIDMLLLGIDTRFPKDVQTGNMRSDTIIIMHIPASHDQAYLMSIPRDTKVDIPAAGNGYGATNDKINAAFFRGAQKGGGIKGGMALATKTVTNLTGIKFDATAVIDFNGFKNVVNAIGTVNMCVDGDTESLHYYKVGGGYTYVNENEADRRNLKPYMHKKGCREMKGWEALDYSRVRKGVSDGTGDYGRQRHQQQLIKAIAKKATSAGIVTDMGKVNALIDAVGTSLTLGLPKGTGVVDFIFTMKDLAGADMVLLKTNNGFFNGVEGGGAEALDAGTMEMFAAAKADKLGEFVLANPDFINKEK